METERQQLAANVTAAEIYGKNSALAAKLEARREALLPLIKAFAGDAELLKVEAEYIKNRSASGADEKYFSAVIARAEELMPNLDPVERKFVEYTFTESGKIERGEKRKGVEKEKTKGAEVQDGTTISAPDRLVAELVNKDMKDMMRS